MELVLVALAVALFKGGAGWVLVYVIPPAALIATFGVTFWIGTKFNSRPVLHGVLVGIVGTLMYIALTKAQPEPWQYWLAHALKVIGGALPREWFWHDAICRPISQHPWRNSAFGADLALGKSRRFPYN